MKAVLKCRLGTYSQLDKRLEEIGVVDFEPNIRNKISRGRFTAAFYLK